MGHDPSWAMWFEQGGRVTGDVGEEIRSSFVQVKEERG
jgi:hypothetical protein